MENDVGECMDIYIPRKCSSSNRIIHAKDHASIQIIIADVDPITGRMTDTTKQYAICGAIRRMLIVCFYRKSSEKYSFTKRKSSWTRQLKRSAIGLMADDKLVKFCLEKTRINFSCDVPFN